jgi:hypothetical protein
VSGRHVIVLSSHSQAQEQGSGRIEARFRRCTLCKLRRAGSDRDGSRIVTEAPVKPPSYSCQEIQITRSAPSPKSGQGRFKRCRRSQRIQFDLGYEASPDRFNPRRDDENMVCHSSAKSLVGNDGITMRSRILQRRRTCARIFSLNKLSCWPILL